MKKIIMFTGGVETLEYFSLEMGKKFEQMGYTVFFYDLKDQVVCTKRVRKFIKPNETVMVTFNFQGLEQEPGVYQEGVGYIWDSYRIPCYNIAADHPYYYHNRLCDLPKDYHHISIDRLHAEYVRSYYPEFLEEGFLPLAGTALKREGQDKEKNGKVQPIAKEMDVIMTGNYTTPSFCEPYINAINEEYAGFYRGIIEELCKKPWQTVEQVARRCCERELGSADSRDLRQVFYRMIFIDLYVRNYWRGMVISTLVDAGITVDVIGGGWDELECVHPENLRIHPQTDSLTCLKQIQKAWISVNVMPWFKDGAHDRVFNSILNGAVCVSDTSRYLCEQLQEGEGVCYFDLQNLDALPAKVKELLQNRSLMQDIVAKGKAKVPDMHTWEQRAETLAGWFEKNARQIG